MTTLLLAGNRYEAQAWLEQRGLNLTSSGYRVFSPTSAAGIRGMFGVDEIIELPGWSAAPGRHRGEQELRVLEWRNPGLTRTVYTQEPAEQAPYGRKLDGTPKKRPGRKSDGG